LEVKLVKYQSSATASEEALTARRDALKVILGEQAKSKGMKELEDLLTAIEQTSDAIRSAKSATVVRERRAARAREILDAVGTVLTALTVVGGDRSALDMADASSRRAKSVAPVRRWSRWRRGWLVCSWAGVCCHRPTHPQRRSFRPEAAYQRPAWRSCVLARRGRAR
jgi:hypothetical protein